MNTGDFQVHVIQPGELDELIQEGKVRSEAIMAQNAEATKVAREVLGFPGAMMSGSKSGYRQKYPNNLAIFNANICTENGKIWYGDMDCTKSENKLKELATKLGTKIYVLYEMDARFDNEEKPRIERAVFVTDGTTCERKD